MVSVKPLIVHWHQDSAPIYSACFQPSNGITELDELPRLVTAGGDNHVRVWRLRTRAGQEAPQVEYCATLAKHERAVNCVAFDPSGKVLASAGDDGIVLLWTPQGSVENSQCGVENDDRETWRLLNRCRTASFGEIYDLSWSPSGRYVAATSMDRVVSVLDTFDGSCVAALRDHKHYVQGVSWDPKDEFLATQSSDQRVLVYSLKYDSGKLTFALTSRIDKTEVGSKTFAFHSESFPSFFRRLSFSPDGSLLIVPSCQAFAPKETNNGEHTNFTPKNEAENQTKNQSDYSGDVKSLEILTTSPECQTVDELVSHLPSSPLRESVKVKTKESNSGTTENVALVFRRGDLQTPSACLPLPKASCVVRFSPILYTLRPGSSSINLPYRMIYAVTTLNGVFLYDTQQSRPLGTASNLHYSAITDLAWTPDGRQLLLTSIDGFCSVLRFSEGELGTPTNTQIPIHANDTPNPHIDTIAVKAEPVNTLIARRFLRDQPQINTLTVRKKSVKGT